MELAGIVTNNHVIYLPKLTASVFEKLGLTFFSKHTLVLDPFLYDILRGRCIHESDLRKRKHLKQIKTHAFFGKQRGKFHWFNPRGITMILLLSLSSLQLVSGQEDSTQFTNVDCTRINCETIDDIYTQLQEDELKPVHLFNTDTIRQRLIEIALSPPWAVLKNCIRGPAVYYHKVKDQATLPFIDQENKAYTVMNMTNSTEQLVFTKDSKDLPEDLYTLTSTERKKIRERISVKESLITPGKRMALANNLINKKKLKDGDLRALWMGIYDDSYEKQMNKEFPGLLEIVHIAKTMKTLDMERTIKFLSDKAEKGMVCEHLYSVEDSDISNMFVKTFTKHYLKYWSPLSILTTEADEVTRSEIIATSLWLGFASPFTSIVGFVIKNELKIDVGALSMLASVVLYNTRLWSNYHEGAALFKGLVCREHTNIFKEDRYKGTESLEETLLFNALLKTISTGYAFMYRRHKRRGLNLSFDLLNMVFMVLLMGTSNGVVSPSYKVLNYVTTFMPLVSMLKGRGDGGNEGNEGNEGNNELLMNQEQATSEEQGDDLDSYDSSPDFNSGDELHSSDSDQSDDFDE